MVFRTLLSLLGLAVLFFAMQVGRAGAAPPPMAARSTPPSASLALQASPVVSVSATTSSPAGSGYIKGLYMTYHAVGHDGLRTHALDLIKNTELNALVVDIKGDLGVITYASDVITATTIGANHAPTMRDWQAFMQELKANDIYAIARIVVFKDDYLGRAKPEWAVKTQTGQLWLDREKLPWLEPFHEAVWDYNIALAVEAARRGFDEIQFDYVRFPTDGSLGSIAYSQPIDQAEVRTAAIVNFLARAKQALAPYNVRLGVDVFGYTAWHQGDFRIGQDLSQIAAHVDVISPMAYPSTYDHGLPGLSGYEFAIDYPYEVVYETTIRALAKTKAVNPDIIIRPWIQNFPDYGFDRRTYTPDEIRQQMFAAYDAGGGGWLLWDPRVRYTPEALVADTIHYPANEQGDILILQYETFGEQDQGRQRTAQSFRRDLEQLWAAGFYPLNLADLAVGPAKYGVDFDYLAQSGGQPFYSEALTRSRLNMVPAGKRPVVLTFDGSHLSQYRLQADGRVDPHSAVGVLLAFHQEHPADWPLRATFFVQPEADDPAYRLFGQPEWAAQKLRQLVAWGIEVGSYPVNGPDLSASSHQELRRLLSSEAKLEALLPGYEIESLALPGGNPPKFRKLLSSGTFEGNSYDYSLAAGLAGQPAPSPRATAFDRYHVPRVPASPEAVTHWITLYQTHPDRAYVSAGMIPSTGAVLK